MNYDEFNQFCDSLPATTHVVQWGNSHVWKVGVKVFAIGGWAQNRQPAFTFKVSDRNFAYLREHDGYRPAPYFASRGMKWIQQTDTAGALDEELRYYLSESYRIVLQGLSKRQQKALEAGQTLDTATDTSGDVP
jgi:predicted DNA-binding protein (MmcQ/YjbR family)